MAEVILTVEQGDAGGGAWSEGARWHIGRTLGGHKSATTGTADGVIVMGGDEGPNLWQLPGELDLRQASVLVPLSEAGLAGGALGREVVTDGVDVVGVGSGPLVAGMPRLTTGLPPAWHARWSWWGRRRVG
jgi:uncharacterized transporter YbjL